MTIAAQGVCRQRHAMILTHVLFVLQSDTESASPTTSSSDYESVSSADVAAQGEGGDPTMRAQEIISRAVSILQL